jgi:quinol-cytochrome oxidoreductase complex cytochrome b subunit
MSVPGWQSVGHDAPGPSMPFVPHFLLRDIVGWYVALGLLAALAALFPWELGQKADPFASAPEGIQPEWYFLFMFQTLKLLPPRIGPFEGEICGVLFFGVCGLALLLIPFFDRGRLSRAALSIVATLSVVFFIVMTAWGWFSGPTEGTLRIILGSLLAVIVVPLLIPFTQPQSNARQAVYALLTIAGLVFLVASWWEMLG